MAKSDRKTARPASTPEGRENQLISLAFDLAEKQLREGTAAAQVIAHFLKLGSTREGLEHEKLKRENLLLAAKVENIANSALMTDLYKAAIKAMRTYAGQDDADEEDDEAYEDVG